MYSGNIILVLIYQEFNACDHCYFDENTCPNNYICVYGEGYWKEEAKVEESDKLVPIVNKNKDWPFIEE